MGNLFSIICFSLLAIISFIDYLKDRKVYRLLITIIMTIYIFRKTPLAKNIGEIGDNTLLGIVLVLTFATLYLLVKEFKKRKK